MGLRSTVIPTRDHSRLKNLDLDKHPHYQKESEKDAASGYAGLDANARVPMTGMPDMALNKVIVGQGSGNDPVEQFLPLIKANDELRHSNDTERKGTNGMTTPEKLKEVKLDEVPPSTIRIKFELAAEDDTYTAHAQIYRNGGAIGTQRTTTSNVYATFTEDFDCSAWAVDDLIQIYGWVATTSKSNIKNMQFFYGIQYDATNQDP